MLLEGRTIGLVEDDAVMGGSLVQSLSLEGCHVEWWNTASDAIRELKKTTPDLVICDIRLPDMEGGALFRQLAATMSLPPVLFVTAYGDIDQAVALMREGAADYVTKPFEIGGFIEKVRTLIQRNTGPRPEFDPWHLAGDAGCRVDASQNLRPYKSCVDLWRDRYRKGGLCQIST